MQFPKLLVAVFLFLSPASQALAFTPPVEARLVAEHDRIAPGTATTLALVLRLPDGWYTYWKNPGDSGLPVRISWTLPAGATVSPLIWPVPSVFGEATAANYGFKGEVILLVSLQAPPALQSGGRLAVQAAVDWLLCKDACVPGSANLSLAVPVANTARRAGGEMPGLFSRARARLPLTQTVPTALMRERGSAVEFVFRGTALAGQEPGYWFPEEEGLFEAPARQAWRREGASWILRLAKAPTWKRTGPAHGILRAAGSAGPAWRIGAASER